MNCDPNFLSQQASCLLCGLSDDQLSAAKTSLLCAWANVAGGVVPPHEFVPTDIAGLQHWLKADAGVFNDAGVTLATNGQTVQQWNDQSGNARHVTQAVAGSRPIFNTGIRNGLPAVAFDGINDFLSVAGVDIMSVTAGKACTLFTVCFPTVGGIVVAVYSQESVHFIVDEPSGAIFSTSSGTESFKNWGAIPSWHSMIITRAGNGAADCNVYIDGSNAGQTQQAIANGLAGNLFVGIQSDGATWPFQQYIAEAGIYNSVLSVADRTNLVNYLRTRWATP